MQGLCVCRIVKVLSQMLCIGARDKVVVVSVVWLALTGISLMLHYAPFYAHFSRPFFIPLHWAPCIL